MNKTFVLLGKTGDLISALPLFGHAAIRTGEKVRVVACNPYAQVLDGCSYVQPMIFDGKAWELDKAIEFARTYGEVTCLQMAGPADMLRKHTFHAQKKYETGSFVKEVYHVAGQDDLWEKYAAPVFDQRDEEREKALVKSLNIKPTADRNKSKLILVAAGGTNAPFPYRDLLVRLLQLQFKGHQVIDISDVKAERFYDLLAVYELAKVLVASDSAPLHLAYAVPTLPVAALVNEKPVLWNGSPWRPQHVFHARYSSFPTRALELLNCIENLTNFGQPFAKRREGRKLIHVWSQYEAANAVARNDARLSWQKQYDTGHWMSTPAETGVFGRDTKTNLRDTMRLPYLKDVMRMACARANDDDIIVLTRCDTCFSDTLTEELLANPLAYCHRAIYAEGELTHHPATDLFAMPKRFWMEHHTELPDFVLGLDAYWHRVMREWLKGYSAKELFLSVWRKVA